MRVVVFSKFVDYTSGVEASGKQIPLKKIRPLVMDCDEFGTFERIRSFSLLHLMWRAKILGTMLDIQYVTKSI